MSTDLRARSASELVDAALALYRRDLLQYVMVTAIAYAPAIILQIVLQDAAAAQDTSRIIAMSPLYLVSFACFALSTGVVARMGADVYLGGRADVAGTVKAVLPRLITLIIATLILTFLYLVFTLLLLFPFFWIFATSFAVVPVIVLENKSALDAIGRSAALSKGRRWPVLGTLLLAFGIYFALSIGVMFLGSATGSTLMPMLLSSLYSIFAYPIVNLVVLLLYYDLRIRKEGFDLEHMAAGLSTPSMGTAPNAI
jgi:hypothetical protein